MIVHFDYHYIYHYINSRISVHNVLRNQLHYDYALKILKICN